MIDYEELARRGREANLIKLGDYAKKIDRIRLASLRALRGESGETVESILNEHANQLRAELDEYIRSRRTKDESTGAESGAGLSSGATRDGSAERPGEY